ncbi:Protein translocase subunit SecF [bioreactor metagenome]|uniref:Protein translocase subunit SecF n=1 Tax=bioreactor metagenome TaxID=1076179 RepID=A0A645CMN2_9ZZZZ|nr:protein translocase subunit SecF [Clostridium sp. HMP27]KGK87905.1 preprotein translocase subunit SecF [Clostridium sp. HMP27]
MKSFKIMEKTKIWFAISLVIIITGLVFFIKDGLNYGIDFRGGTLVQINMKQDFNKQDVEKIIAKYANDYTTNTAVNEKNEVQLEIRSNSLEEGEIQPLFKEVKDKYKLADKDLISQQTIGPAVGQELRQKAILAFVLANVAILIYVAIRFEFKFGAAAILAIIHDILITVSVYSIFQIPINSSFIAAILTIAGYSINDTIVIFDRIRENVKKMRRIDSKEIANISITQTMSRSVNTTLTTLITIVAVYIFVPSIREFTFPLTIGIACGAYSSIFIASPIWVLLKNRKIKEA